MMKIVYFGNTDSIAKTFVDYVGKEENEIYIISSENFASSRKPKISYRYFNMPKTYALKENLISSITPRVIVFAGMDYMEQSWKVDEKKDQYLSTLTFWLENAVKCGVERFIYLSSTDVYEQTDALLNEEGKVSPFTTRGMLFAQGEHLVSLYQNMYQLNTTILRCSPIYDYCYDPEGSSFLDHMVREVTDKKEIYLEKNSLIQPIFVGDLQDAIKRVIQNNAGGIFNICATNAVRLSELYKGLADNLKQPIIFKSDEEPDTNYSNQKAKRELEWSNFKQLEIQLKKEALNPIKESSKPVKSNQEDNKASRNIRLILENLVIFALMLLLHIGLKNNVMFKGIDWMIIYIIVTALFFGRYRSIMGVVLASIVFISEQNFEYLRMSNFYSSAAIMIKIAEYTFIGLIIAYVRDTKEERIRSQEIENELLQLELGELKEINNQNILIKNEYSKRLIRSKSGLPKLYSVISKVNVLMPELIFKEVLKVVSEIMETDTVSVYSLSKDHSYGRLIDSLNERSVYKGKSWNMKENPGISEAIQKGMVYTGNVWEKEPAMVAPIMYGSECIAVIVICNLPFSKHNLHEMNQMRTLSVLISESVAKAMEYEKLKWAETFVGDTSIMKADAFENIIKISEEKRQEGVADWCLLKVASKEKCMEVYQQIGDMLRSTDYIGISKNGDLYVILGNNTHEEGEFVIKRLEQKNISAEIVTKIE